MTASYPFRTDPVPYAGQWPGDGDWNTWSGRCFWIGNAGSMVQFPDPGADGYTPNRSRGKVVIGLYGGATTTSEQEHATRRYTFTYPRLTPLDRAVLQGLDSARIGGTPPWCFLPPDETNRLTEAQSYGDATAWHVTGGTLTQATGVTSPVPGTNVLQWAPGAAGDLLTPCPVVAGVPTPDTGLAVPVVPAEPSVAAFWAWTATGTASVRARLSQRQADGTEASAVEGDDTTVGTTPRLVPALADPGVFGAAPWLSAELRSNDGTTVYVAAPQHTLTDTVVAWLPGQGVPRVVMVSELDDAVDVNLNAAVTVILAENTLGAL